MNLVGIGLIGVLKIPKKSIQIIQHFISFALSIVID
jgi:hypothetical protein